jgi:hypothetical protein
MPLPRKIRDQVEPVLTDYCATKIPEHVRHQIRIGFEIRGNSVTLIEERPHWQNPDHWTKTPIAQLRYDHNTGKWALFCADRNSRWHRYQAKPTSDIRALLREVDDDPTHIFWG